MIFRKIMDFSGNIILKYSEAANDPNTPGRMYNYENGSLIRNIASTVTIWEISHETQIPAVGSSPNLDMI